MDTGALTFLVRHIQYQSNMTICAQQNRLTDEQKEAAAALGFDEDEWDDSDDEKARYEDVDWKHLLPDVKEAAIKLGYTEEIWDGKGAKKLDIEDEDWEDLTPEQKQLLTILGYNADLVSSALVWGAVVWKL